MISYISLCSPHSWMMETSLFVQIARCKHSFAFAAVAFLDV
jgi:hypothetical protein